MHRTEGQYNVSNLFIDGPPGTRVEEDWLNAVQEEIAYLIETAGLTLKTAATETRQQLYAAVAALIASAVTTHNDVTSPHSAASAATASRLIVRDAAGRAKVADPAVAADIATKNTVDTHGALTSPHSAVSAATASRLVVRDAFGRAKFAEGAATGDAVVFSQFTTSKIAAGYQYLPGGLLIQWGSNVVGSITFPTAFPNACLQVVASEYGSSARSVNFGTNTYTTTTFALTGEATYQASWIAIGY